MFGRGGGGLDPRKMEQMMKQMGIDMDELDAREVIIRLEETELVFENPEVTRMDARGEQTYQVMGDPKERETGAGGAGADADTETADESAAFDDQDVEIVVQRTGVSEDAAREALAENDGDLAAAVADLE